ncbi:WD40 repeat-like protein [Coprinellus micaceus]|uniref:WD40 repeat-like protein n=1 Tax=Coprinellus micaceus TaxID=71717 RepID=A0A4Y7TGU0_COPMI|nr:WD40 repeat-like protein [Coprinellus micaceus]
MSSSGPSRHSLQRWARGLKEDVKDCCKSLICTLCEPESPTVEDTPNFTRTLLKRLPELADENLVKVALSLAQLIMEIKEAAKDNMDMVERRIASTGAQLEIVGDARVSRWGPNDPETPWLGRFQKTLAEELTTLSRLGREWPIKQTADHEHEKCQVAAVFERMNDARMEFELYTDIRTLNTAKSMERTSGHSFLNELKPSRMADHKYYLEGRQKEGLRREVCTPGTRVRILGHAVKWANDPESEDVFWMFGPAGSGKTTIAFTIARRFEATFDADDTITLGGNFLCSRQFEETRLKTCIIRTLVYQLARKCAGFAEALNRVENFDSIDQDVGTQLRDLLIIPWKQYRSTRGSDSSSADRFLFLIDAVDEIERQGGSEFLHDLLTVIHDNHLPGLKFFVTSRSNPEIVSRVESFERKQLVRLQDVEEEEARNDIGTYLEANLPQLKGAAEMDLIQEFVGGLFIVAATIVRHLTLRRTRLSERKALIRRLFYPETQHATSTNPTHSLDNLYTRILTEVFDQFPEEVFGEKLGVLHAFLCTVEPTSTSIVARLLELELEDTGGFTDSTNPADDVIALLHGVLYTDQNHLVRFYHKSFADFIFDKTRSAQFACDQANNNQLLTRHCFRVMTSCLRFNIANIPSSFVFDSDNADLQDEVNRNISPELGYACQSWSHHLVRCLPFPVLFAVVFDFLQLRVLFWIETMNLLGVVTHCGPHLQKASEWVKTHEGDNVLTEQLMETGSFAVYFSTSPSSRSTPHLYLSSLATWPQDIGLALRWREHFPAIPDCRMLSLQDSTPLMTIDVGSKVWTVAMSPDGERIASGSRDGLVRIWDAQSGKQIITLKGHTGQISSAVFAGNGTQIASGSGDGSIRVWDVRTAELEMKLQPDGHGGSVTSVAFSKDGKLLVSGGADNLVRVWSTSTGQEQTILRGHTEYISCVALTPDSTQVISGSWDGTVRMWGVAVGEEHWVARSPTNINVSRVYSVTLSSNGVWIASGLHNGSIQVLDRRTGTVAMLLRGHTGHVRSVAFSGDGSRIVSGAQDAAICVWDMTTGRKLRVLHGHSSYVMSVIFSGDGGRVISGSLDNSVRVWDAEGSAEQDGEGLSARWQGHGGAVQSVAFSGDGTRIVTGSRDKSVRVWDVSSGERLIVLDHADEVNSAMFSADGTRVVSGSRDASVCVWDTGTGEKKLVLRGHTSAVHSVAFTMDGTLIISGSTDKTVRLWGTSTDSDERSVLQGHTEAIHSVAVSIDGTRIISGSADKSVRMWDRTTGEVVMVLLGHTDQVNSIVLSADGTQIVSGSNDRSVRVWDARTGEEKMILEGHTGPVSSVAFSRDGAHIVSGSQDRTVRVWSSVTGEERLVIRGHTDTVASVAFSMDGTHIVSGSRDSMVRVSDLNLGYISEVVDDDATGWLLAPSDSQQEREYLMYVPHDIYLPRSPSFLVISKDYPTPYRPLLKISNAVGDNWQQCYIPS